MPVLTKFLFQLFYPISLFPLYILFSHCLFLCSCLSTMFICLPFLNIYVYRSLYLSVTARLSSRCLTSRLSSSLACVTEIKDVHCFLHRVSTNGRHGWTAFVCLFTVLFLFMFFSFEFPSFFPWIGRSMFNHPLHITESFPRIKTHFDSFFISQIPNG